MTAQEPGADRHLADLRVPALETRARHEGEVAGHREPHLHLGPGADDPGRVLDAGGDDPRSVGDADPRPIVSERVGAEIAHRARVGLLPAAPASTGEHGRERGEGRHSVPVREQAVVAAAVTAAQRTERLQPLPHQRQPLGLDDLQRAAQSHAHAQPAPRRHGRGRAHDDGGGVGLLVIAAHRLTAQALEPHRVSARRVDEHPEDDRAPRGARVVVDPGLLLHRERSQVVRDVDGHVVERERVRGAEPCLRHGPRALRRAQRREHGVGVIGERARAHEPGEQECGGAQHCQEYRRASPGLISRSPRGRRPRPRRG